MATPQTTHYDFIALGSGVAAKVLCWTLPSSGLHCAVVERQWLGGSCPNVACLPSKNFVHSANLVHNALQGSQFGVPAFKLTNESGGSIINMAAVRERKREMVKGVVKIHGNNFQAAGTDVIWGEGRFIGAKKIEVTGPDGEKKILTADKIVIGTGSRARIPDINGLRQAKPLTHVEILELDNIPSHLVILGGGYVGLEFAQAMRRLGAEVTIVEKNPQLLKNEDKDVAAVLVGILQAEGIKIVTSANITHVSGTSGNSVTLTGYESGSPLALTASHILCATGRLPNTDNIGLEAAGIALTADSFVATNESLETSIPGVYAVGDCAGSPYFTHVGYDDFRIVRDALLWPSQSAPPNRRSGRVVPFTLFTTPELAHVGLREREATEMGLQVRVAKLPMQAFLKTRTLGELRGFAKTLIGEDEKILGFTALGSGAGELLPVVQLAMKAGLKYTEIADMIITHPTLGEGLVHLFEDVPVSG